MPASASIKRLTKLSITQCLLFIKDSANKFSQYIISNASGILTINTVVQSAATIYNFIQARRIDSTHYIVAALFAGKDITAQLWAVTGTTIAQIGSNSGVIGVSGFGDNIWDFNFLGIFYDNNSGTIDAEYYELLFAFPNDGKTQMVIVDIAANWTIKAEEAVFEAGIIYSLNVLTCHRHLAVVGWEINAAPKIVQFQHIARPAKFIELQINQNEYTEATELSFFAIDLQNAPYAKANYVRSAVLAGITAGVMYHYSINYDEIAKHINYTQQAISGQLDISVLNWTFTAQLNTINWLQFLLKSYEAIDDLVYNATNYTGFDETKSIAHFATGLRWYSPLMLSSDIFTLPNSGGVVYPDPTAAQNATFHAGY